MNLNEAINITAEEAELRRRADAMDKLVNVARVFSRTADE